jgi:hypothetical protein
VHVAEAERARRRGRHLNANFCLGDASDLHKHKGSLAGLFAVEAACHMPTRAARQQFLASAAAALCPGARLVVLDGFRSMYSAYMSPDVGSPCE